MIWTKHNVLGDQLVTKLLKQYRDYRFNSGNQTNPDTTMKQCLEMSSSEVHECVWDALRSGSFCYDYMITNMTPPHLSWYKEGDFYDWHIDSYPIGGIEANLSTTIFLNDDYEGGELTIKVGDTETSYKPKAGTAITYDTGLWHCVKPVTKGERKVVIVWSQSMVKDSFMRTQLIHLGREVEKLDGESKNTIEQIRINMIRQYGNIR